MYQQFGFTRSSYLANREIGSPAKLDDKPSQEKVCTMIEEEKERTPIGRDYFTRLLFLV